MAKRKLLQIATQGGVGPQLPVGTRVNVLNNATNTGLEVVPDPNGKHEVVSCDSTLIEVQRIDES